MVGSLLFPKLQIKAIARRVFMVQHLNVISNPWLGRKFHIVGIIKAAKAAADLGRHSRQNGMVCQGVNAVAIIVINICTSGAIERAPWLKQQGAAQDDTAETKVQQEPAWLVHGYPYRLKAGTAVAWSWSPCFL